MGRFIVPGPFHVQKSEVLKLIKLQYESKRLRDTHQNVAIGNSVGSKQV